MMLRIVASVIVIATTVWVCDVACLDRYVTNQQESVLRARTLRAQAGSQFVAQRARNNIETVNRLLQKSPTNVDLYMILAANYRILERSAEAVDAYDRALRIEHRPEIYFNRGVVLADVGKREAAAASLVKAVRFMPELIDDIADPLMRAEVRASIDRRRP